MRPAAPTPIDARSAACPTIVGRGKDRHERYLAGCHRRTRYVRGCDRGTPHRAATRQRRRGGISPAGPRLNAPTDNLRGAVVRVWLVVAGFATIALVRSWQIGIPLRDPHGGIFWKRLAIFLVIAAVVALVSAAIRTPAPPTPARVWATLRRHWTRRRLALVVTGLVAYQTVYFCYHNLKSWDVFNHPRDAMLLEWDRWLFLGHNPAVLLHQLLGEHVAMYVLLNVYESFTAVTSLMLVAGLVLPKRIGDSYVYLASGLWVWILGVGSYYLIPSLGPFHSAPEQFAGLPDTVIQHTQAYYMEQRAQMFAHPSWPTSF